MLESLLSRNSPVAHMRLWIAQIWRVAIFLVIGGIVWMNLRKFVDGWEFPSSRTISDEGIGKENDWGEMFECNLSSHKRCIETVRRTGRSNNGHWRLTVSPVECLQQVGLLALGGQSCRRSATLHIDDNKRKLVDDGEVDGFTLQANARSRCACCSQCSCKRSSDGAGAARDFVFALHSDDAHRLVFGKFMKDVGCGSDWIRAKEKSQSSPFGGCHESVGCSLVTRDVHILARHFHFRLDAISCRYRSMDIMSIVVSCIHHFYVVFCNFGFTLEFLAQEVLNECDIAIKEPAHESEREHIAALQDSLVVHTRVGKAIFHHLRDGACDDAVGIDTQFLQIVIAGNLGLFQVIGTERVGVDDDGGLRLGITQLCLQCCGIHSHEHVTEVARSVYTPSSYVDLKTTDAR